MSVCFVAAPLTARSGVYRSARELVAAGRELGLDWKLVLGVSSEAAGAFPLDDPDWIDEFPFEPSGLGGILGLRTRLRRHPLFDTASMVISLIPQTDMALSTMRKPWIAFLRGQPWPEPDEIGAAKRRVWKSLEKVALRRADEIWATTQVLSNYAGIPRIRIVPAGVRPVSRTWDGRGNRDRAVWAARYNQDKNPTLFLETLNGMALDGVMHGSGPLTDELRDAAPDNVRVAGWVPAAELWTDALAYLGTSHREAFGRSALEAAMNGVPVVLADSFGVAPFLVTDTAFHSRFVLPTSDVGPWRAALEALRRDEGLRVAYSEHLVENAAKLTIAASAEAVAAQLR